MIKVLYLSKNKYITATSLTFSTYILNSSIYIKKLVNITGNQLYMTFSIWIFSFFFSNYILSQSLNIGTPLIKNYTKEQYSGGTQSWDALYGNNDLIYFANNDGLIYFDGKRWSVQPLPNTTILRSLAQGEGSSVYVGGQDELGYFKPDEKGFLAFHSLKEDLPQQHKNLEDIWEMVFINEMLFFRSNHKIFRYQSQTFEVYEDAAAITFLAQHQNQVIFNDLGKGFYTWTDDAPKFLAGSEIFKNIPVVDIIDLSPQQFLILTERNGIYIYKDGVFEVWQTNVYDYLETNRVSSGAVLKNGNIAIGTLVGGLLIFNKDGEAIYKITKENGLQNNSISTICIDNSDNIWLGTYNGIDQIILSDHLNLFFPDGQLEGAVYDVESWNGHLFFGTNNGLYYIEQKNYYHPLEPQDMTLVPGSVGQVWGLDIIDDQLLMAHNDGAFVIGKDFIARKISPTPGAWKFIKLADNKMVVGTYNGIDIYAREKEDWVWERKFEEFGESSRIMVLDQLQNLWISHPYRGVYKIKFNPYFTKIDIRQLSSADGIPTNKRNYVFNVNGNATITNPKGMYSYNATSDKFEMQSIISDRLKAETHVKRLIQHRENIWYISDLGIGQIQLKKNGLEQSSEVIPDPNIGDIFVGGFENLFPLDNDNIFLCTDKGVLYYNKSNIKNDFSIKPKINRVQLLQPKDSLLIANNVALPLTLALQSNENALKFYFTSNYFQNPENVNFSYKLEGTDVNWSEWSKNSSKEYTNLAHGNHKFQLKARTPSGNESEIVTLAFTVMAPWYKSTLAKLTYLILTGLALLALIMIPRRKFNEEKAILKSQQQQTAAEVEKLKNEKLETEIQHKNKELASSTMHLLQKNETLSLLKIQIDKTYNKLNNTEAKKEIKKLISLIDNDLQLEDDWKKFSYHFDQVHREFLERIKKQYPHLTPKDLKLCAYLRMNLSTKEIAPLLNISVRGVEIGRYRLRKKLELDKGVNLNDFMIGF